MTANWILDSFDGDSLRHSAIAVGRELLSQLTPNLIDLKTDSKLETTAHGLELAVFDLLDGGALDEVRGVASQAFEHFRALAIVPTDLDQTEHVLCVACYGTIGDRTPDVARYLKNIAVPRVPSDDWGGRVRSIVLEVWIRILRKSGWDDLDAIFDLVVKLRELQSTHEASYLDTSERVARTHAWELVTFYHLAKAAEVLATFTAQGEVGGTFDIRPQLQAQFDRSILSAERGELVRLFSLSKLLSATAERVVGNSIWTVTRAVNSRVTKFVLSLVDRQKTKPVFDVLPPQRVTLSENGLLGSSHRSVVVSLPTSSGKTFIAQFRILQALNQFDVEQGWVAYIVPTRALVNQVTAKLRRDFEPIGIVVERVSPALEIDGVEADLLMERSPGKAFRVLVGTPEKLDLLLRGGWEAKIGRPLTLVVVDEAHNLGNNARGLRLELLLATINRECRNSQFLLLTPFITNRAEIARWLSPDSSKDISLSFDWQANDRAIVLASPKQTSPDGEFSIELKTLHTSRQTIDVPDTLQLTSGRPLGLSWSKVKSHLSNIAAVTAKSLSARGTVIVVANKIPHTWAIARRLAEDPKTAASSHPDINLVCQFAASEFGDDFELIEMLQKGIGLHHSGLSDEIRTVTEWLVENERLSSLVATTTVAQGVNFPVSGVVLAGHQYPYGNDMPSEDFWNLAGRAGRTDHVGLGVIALAVDTAEREAIVTSFVNQNVAELNSTLVQMCQKILEIAQPLNLSKLFHMKEWSAFLQYLAHSYRQIGDHSSFSSQIEQILRGSFGFQAVRRSSPQLANILVGAVNRYAEVLEGKPLALVDSTGFSWESVSLALGELKDTNITSETWDPSRLFADGTGELADAFGVLFKVPEIRSELQEAITGHGRDSDLLARIVKDWVQGASIADIATEYFEGEKRGKTDSVTAACQSVYGNLVQAASWGLSALQSLTVGQDIETMSDEERVTFRNLPSRVYYGVNSDDAINLRLLGIPRRAAQPLSETLSSAQKADVGTLRRTLASPRAEAWGNALGAQGEMYSRIWRVIEGFE